MRRVVAVLGALALVAILLFGGREGGRAAMRSIRDDRQAEAAAGEADGLASGDVRVEPATPLDARPPLPPGRIEIRILDVDTHEPVPDLEVGLGERFRRTGEDGVAAWEGTAPGWLEVRFPRHDYRPVADQPKGLFAELATRPVTVYVQKRTTLRLVFAHDDATPVGEVIDRVTGGDAEALESTVGETTHSDWLVRTGSAVSVWAVCEDGYEAETEIPCEAWPFEKRTVVLKPTAPRGRSRLTFEVVAEETGEPIAGASVGYHYVYGDSGRGRWMHQWREGVTDANGIGVLEDIPTAGDGWAFAWTRGRRDGSEQQTKLEPGSPRLLRFALARATRPGIRGTCPDRPAATIRLKRGDYTRTAELVDGAFAFHDLEPGEYTVHATDGDDTVSVAAVPGGPPVLVPFPPRGTLALDCRDALGRVPASVHVVMEREGARGNRYWLEPEGGRFRMPVAQGPVLVSVEAEGYRTATVPVHVVGGAVNEAAVPLGHPLPILDVQVVDPAGAPVPGARVEILRRADPPARGSAGSVREELWWERKAALETPGASKQTALDGWARFTPDVAEPQEVDVSLSTAAVPDRAVRVPATGRVTATFLVVPLPRVRVAANESHPPLLDDDLLIQWDGRPLRLEAEVPRRWTEPIAVKVIREGEEIELVLPPMTREFTVEQALLPPPAR